MVRRIPDRLKSGVATVLAALTLALGIAVPMLDIGSERHTAFESDHAAACHIPLHDHSVCVQFGNQRTSSGEIRPTDWGLDLTRLSVAAPVDILADHDHASPTHPRAPPLPDRL